jgi:plastocyanin
MQILVTAAVALLLAASVDTPPSTFHGTVHVGEKLQPEAVVWLEAPNTVHATSRRTVLDQRNLTFEPRVLAVRTGTTVDLPNSDRVFHNVFSFREGKRFDLGMYPVGTSKRVTFDRQGLVRVFCNIHPAMAAYIMVVDTPYFAVSDRGGAFSIPSVPSGHYTYHAWRAGSEIISGQVDVNGESTFDVRWP